MSHGGGGGCVVLRGTSSPSSDLTCWVMFISWDRIEQWLVGLLGC